MSLLWIQLLPTLLKGLWNLIWNTILMAELNSYPWLSLIETVLLESETMQEALSSQIIKNIWSFHLVNLSWQSLSRGRNKQVVRNACLLYFTLPYLIVSELQAVNLLFIFPNRLILLPYSFLENNIRNNRIKISVKILICI